MASIDGQNSYSDLFLDESRKKNDSSLKVITNGRKTERLVDSPCHVSNNKLSLKSSDDSSSFGSNQKSYLSVKKLPEGKEKILTYSTISQEEKEQKTQNKLEAGNPDGPSGEAKVVLPYKSLTKIVAKTEQIPQQLQAAVRKLKMSDAKSWNNAFDATTDIRKIVKHNPELIKNDLDQIMESLAGHMQSNQSVLVSAILTTAEELALSQKADFKAALDKVLTIQASPKPVSSALIGFIINIGNSSKQFIKEKAVEALAQIKSETAVNDTEWIRCIGELVEKDLLLQTNKGGDRNGLRLMSKKGSADVIKEQLVTDKTDALEISEVVSLLKKLVENKNLTLCKAQVSCLREIRTHIGTLEETLKTSKEEHTVAGKNGWQ